MDPLGISNVRNIMQTERAAETVNNRDQIREAANTNPASKEDAGAVGKAAADKKTERAQAEAVQRSTYGDVLDISEDGDTVTARPEALKALDDGLVLFKGEEENGSKATQTLEEEEKAAEAREEIRKKQEEAAEEAKEAREELREKAQSEKASEKTAEKTAEETAEEDNASAQVSLNGYSDNMIDTLHRQGKIDDRTYNAEESRRERIEEAEPSDEDNADRTNDRIGRLREGAEELGELNAQAQSQRLEDEAFETALENGRGDIFQNLFVEQTN